jgi:hypothetical protein
MSLRAFVALVRAALLFVDLAYGAYGSTPSARSDASNRGWRIIKWRGDPIAGFYGNDFFAVSRQPKEEQRHCILCFKSKPRRVQGHQPRQH